MFAQFDPDSAVGKLSQKKNVYLLAFSREAVKFQITRHFMVFQTSGRPVLTMLQKSNFGDNRSILVLPSVLHIL